MKLKFKRLSKKYGNKLIFRNLSLEFKNCGFYAIVGESGCGKSTLLNILGLIDNKFDGNVTYKDVSFNDLDDEEKKNIRLKEFGYIFQSFNLLEDDTVYNNLKLIIEASSNSSREFNERKIDELLKELDIFYLKYKIVNKLSGGEKQRVAIVRALLNDPEIVFCDEPTGSLDNENSESVFKILKELSKRCLIILVTHDVTLAKKYSDIMITFSNKNIEEKILYSNSNSSRRMVSMKSIKNKRNGVINLNFIFSHFKNKIKVKKVRYSITSLLVSFSLISLGVAILITTNISSTLKNAFSSIVGNNSLILKRIDNDNQLLSFVASEKYKLEQIKKDYMNDIEYIGCNYLVDFEEYFIDQNSVFNVTRFPSEVITGFSARNFNEFEYLSSTEIVDMYPKSDLKLKNDELILGLNFPQVKRICMNLQIVRTYESLGNYILNKEFNICIYLANNFWNYSDELKFKVRGIIPTNRPIVYHTNPLFNEYFFENSLRFPSSLEILKKEELPWIMKKVFYLKTYNFQAEFINKITYDEKYSNILFDSENDEYSPLSCPLGKYTNKIYTYTIFNKGINRSLIKIIKELNTSINGYYYSSPGGYLNYGNSLFCGFAKPIYLTQTKEKADELIDKYTFVNEKDNDEIILPKGIIEGNAFKINKNNLKISVDFSKTISGNYPTKINEIAISKGILDFLGVELKNLKEIFLTLNYKDSFIDGRIMKFYKTTKINVCGVILDDYGFNLYHKSDFSIALFRDLFKESSFSLIPNAIVFETSDKINDVEIKTINSYFEEYELINPMKEINESIEEVMVYLKIILYLFSFVTVVSSIIILSIINYINIEEDKKEIAILSLLGFRAKEILKISLFNNLFMGILSLISGSLSIILIDSIVSFIFEETLGYSSTFSFPFLSIISMCIVMAMIIFISVIVTYNPIKKIDILKNIH